MTSLRVSSFVLLSFFACKLTFAQQTILSDSNLPIVVITSDNNPATGNPFEIVDSPKTPATMKIIYRPDGSRNFLTDINNSTFLNYNGKIMIEYRGSSSQLLPKKPYSLSTKLADNITNNNVSLLGMAEENDWVLNSLAFDPSMIRDKLSYDLYQNLGNYSVQGKYVEVIENGDYKGVYILMERIKVDSKRVNLQKMTNNDNSLPNLSGGYIVKSDKLTGGDVAAWQMWGSGGLTDFIFDYPKPLDITNNQKQYINNYFVDLASRTSQNNANISNGFPDLIDFPSFIDFMLIAEISSNVDAYSLSTFYHKDRGGKLRAGPIWDYNLTFGNDLFLWGFDRSHTNVWQFNNGSNTGPFFWLNLFNNASFKCYLAKRWFATTAVNQPLNLNKIIEQINFYKDLLTESAAREQERWGTVGSRLINIQEMITWLGLRITWMNNNIGSSAACNNPTLPNLVISKIHYNPLNQGSFTSDELEFIEITNHSSATIDLTGFYIRELGISYKFPVSTFLQPNQKIYLSSNPQKFAQFYGFSPFGGYARTLSNKSYNIVLSDAFGNIIDQVHYQDAAPWPTAADGNGSFLCLNNLNSDNALPSNWGTCQSLSIDENKVTSESIVLYPNPAKNQLNLQANNFAISQVTIFDLHGRQVAEQSFVGSAVKQILSVDITALNPGLYYIAIVSDEGLLFNKTILKQ